MFQNLCNANFDVDIFITTELIPTNVNPELYVVSYGCSCLGKLLQNHAGWRVEFTAGTGGGATTAVPDGVCGIGLIGVGEKESP